MGPKLGTTSMCRVWKDAEEGISIWAKFTRIGIMEGWGRSQLGVYHQFVLEVGNKCVRCVQWTNIDKDIKNMTKKFTLDGIARGEIIQNHIEICFMKIHLL
jgi:hypothetical protein